MIKKSAISLISYDAYLLPKSIERYYEYVDEFQEFLEDWYKIKDEAPF